MALPIDPYTYFIVIVSFGIFFLSVILKILKMPSVIAYILAGIILGSSGFGFIQDTNVVSAVGNVGVILLLFFIGMEVSLKRIAASWRIAFGSVILQILFSFLFVSTLGFFLDWPFGRIVLISFVITLSSTAVVLKILNNNDELKTKVGGNVLSILLVQDIALIPMIIILSLLGGTAPSFHEISIQIMGAFIIIGLLVAVSVKGKFSIPIPEKYKKDRELQVFMAFALCFGFAFFTGIMGLSTALGAFVAGIFIAYTKEIKWIRDSLHSFYVIFVALFFLSVGLLLDLSFVFENYFAVISLTLFAFLINGFINILSFRSFGMSWRESTYPGILLTQIGEFSFILAAVGLSIGVIDNYGYDLTIATIALSLLISPILIFFSRKLIERQIRKGDFNWMTY